ncbi:MAG TPA: hypothetical protein VJ718_10880 [Candidatus Binataceae bacterium]|nr:hypothetical protein [Candidatus Binataceae bacterium]
MAVNDVYEWDDRNHLAAIGDAVSASFVCDAFDRRMRKTIGANTTRSLYDGLNPAQELDGSAIALAGPGGALTTTYTYEPFGNVAASGDQSGNSYQFTGRENDGAGLYYYRVGDPYGCSLLQNATTGAMSIYRRPLPATNLRFATALMWDEREPDLTNQATDATLDHDEAAGPLTSGPIAAIVSFESSFYTSRSRCAAIRVRWRARPFRPATPAWP